MNPALKLLNRNRSGVSLMELIIVISLLALIAIPSVIGFSRFRAGQAVVSSSEVLAGVLQRARIYSRESKGDKSWGVRYKDTSTYEFMSRESKTDVFMEAEYQLAPPVSFSSSGFEVWFDQATGQTENEVDIVLQTPQGHSRTIRILKSGLISEQI